MQIIQYVSYWLLIDDEYITLKKLSRRTMDYEKVTLSNVVPFFICQIQEILASII